MGDLTQGGQDWQQGARGRMVEQQLRQRGITNPRVLEAMQRVPRHEFVPEESQHLAYEDSPQPLEAGQTISQPYIVAMMTQALNPQPTDRVLEIGVGSGYQTAILAELVAEVVGLERVPALAVTARRRLERLGYDNVTVRIGDGTEGYAPAAPYDGIIAAAAGPRIPKPLLSQLAEGGRLVIPVGSVEHEQVLKLVIRKEDGEFVDYDLTSVRFVPLIGKHGFDDKQET